MTPNEYQELTAQTEIYTTASRNFLRNILLADEENVKPAHELLSLMYCVGKLNGEAGEVAELVFKALRDGVDEAEYIDSVRKAKLFKELGDCQWYISRIAGILGFNLEDIMQGNIDKLMDRKDRGVLSGSGDDR